MSQQFVGEIRLFPYNFAPRTWAYCQGQLLPVNQNQALFSLLGTQYGGNGSTTFALPDLRGRAVNSPGAYNGANYVQGQMGGSEGVTLTIQQLPAHTHTWSATSDAADKPTPLGNLLAGGRTAGAPTPLYAPAGTGAQVTLAPSTLAPAGGSLPHNNMQPFLVLGYCIALQGIFPSRN